MKRIGVNLGLLFCIAANAVAEVDITARNPRPFFRRRRAGVTALDALDVGLFPCLARCRTRCGVKLEFTYPLVLLLLPLALLPFFRKDTWPTSSTTP